MKHDRLSCSSPAGISALAYKRAALGHACMLVSGSSCVPSDCDPAAIMLRMSNPAITTVRMC